MFKHAVHDCGFSTTSSSNPRVFRQNARFMLLGVPLVDDFVHNNDRRSAGFDSSSRDLFTPHLRVKPPPGTGAVGLFAVLNISPLAGRLMVPPLTRLPFLVSSKLKLDTNQPMYFGSSRCYFSSMYPAKKLRAPQSHLWCRFLLNTCRSLNHLVQYAIGLSYKPEWVDLE